jgi:chromate reductase
VSIHDASRPLPVAPSHQPTQEITVSQNRIAVIVGSLRKDSFNRKLAHALMRMAPPDFVFEELPIADLPLYNQDDDAAPAEPVRRLKASISAASGVMFVTPEYNRSMPGVLKNAIDHASRPYGQSAWAGKPAGVLGVSIGAIGTAMAQQHLRNVLAYLDMPTMGQPEVFLQAKDGLFDAQGDIAGGSRAFLQGWLDTYLDWVRKHS